MLVSCITPTYNRRAYLPRAIELFLRQDYPDRELIILDDGTDDVRDLIPNDPSILYHRLHTRLTIGAKRNLACQHARGEIIVHWDDDDWYPSDRITRQVQAILEANADYSGSSTIYFADDQNQTAFLYRYEGYPQSWVVGATLAYRKSLWARNLFLDVSVAEDTYFLLRAGAKGIDLADPLLSIASIHPGNVCPRQTTGMFWTPYNYDALSLLKHRQAPSPQKSLSALAFICAFNEADIIRWTIRGLHEQGVDVHLIDNGSTDGTAEIAAECGLAGFESVPRASQQSWVELLRIVEARAASSRADWCLHHDADEIRRVPSGESLAQGFARLNSAGYTAVDHNVYEFVHTQDGFDGTQDPEPFFTHYRLDTLNQRCGQVKSWRNLGPVNLASSAGHRVAAPWIRVAPERWIMKHYPIRSQAHGKRKVFQERAWSSQEKSWNWHVQYDGIRPDQNLIGMPDRLLKWSPPPTLAIVTLTRFADIFQQLARSLQGCTGLKTVVTSGGSPVEEQGWLSVAGPEPFVFARNVNTALRLSSCQGCDVLLVNDDVRFRSPQDPLMLQQLAHSDPSVGILSPKIFGGVGNRNQSAATHTGSFHYEDAERLCFVCVLIKASVLSQVGMLDESFDGYGGDDDDYCLRTRQAGFRLAITDQVTVDHGHDSPIHASASFLRVMSDAERVSSMRSMRGLLELKHGRV